MPKGSMEVFKIIVDLVSAVIWPLVVVWVVYLLRPEIKNLTNMFNDSTKFSFKIGGQELSIEKALKEEVVKETLETEPANDNGYVKRDKFTKRMEVLIPFLGERIDTDHLIMINELRKSGGKMEGAELFRASKRAGVFAGLGGKLTALHSSGLIAKDDDNHIVLTELGERVASIAPKFLHEIE